MSIARVVDDRVLGMLARSGEAGEYFLVLAESANRDIKQRQDLQVAEH
jgi:hypothetical protein